VLCVQSIESHTALGKTNFSRFFLEKFLTNSGSQINKQKMQATMDTTTMDGEMDGEMTMEHPIHDYYDLFPRTSQANAEVHFYLHKDNEVVEIGEEEEEDDDVSVVGAHDLENELPSTPSRQRLRAKLSSFGSFFRSSDILKSPGSPNQHGSPNSPGSPGSPGSFRSASPGPTSMGSFRANSSPNRKSVFRKVFKAESVRSSSSEMSED
jgi:hypothetical protein